MVDELPEIIIFDSAMAQVSRINSYTSLEWIHSWGDVDTFTITTNRYKKNVDALVESGYIAFVSGLGSWCVGCVDSIEKPLDETGKQSEVWTITGQGIESVLSNRLMMHAWATGDGYDTQTAEAETNMRHYVNVEVIAATDTNRRLSGITLAADSGRGAAIEYKARAPLDLTTVLRDHCLQSGLSYGLVWSGTGLNFVFTVYEGTDLSSGAGKVVLSIEYGDVKAYDYIYSVLDQRNFVYIGGPGDGAARTLETLPASSIPTGWTRRETFVDATECTESAERTAKGNQVLTERAATQTLDFTFNQWSPLFVLGTDFTLGDIVVVEFPEVATMTSRITSITERYDVSKGKVYGIGVGKEAPYLISIIKAQTRKITNLSTR